MWNLARRPNFKSSKNREIGTDLERENRVGGWIS